MADPLLETVALESFYGDFQALFGIDFAVGRGEVVAVVGANGAGKTTLMRSITGLLQCRPGMVRWQSKDIGGRRPDQIAAMGIAMVPEGRQLFPSLTVEENLLIGGQLRRPGSWTLARIYELFPVLGERRQQQSTSLSGGQQQMAAIGRALMSNPELILLDEISLGLAPIIIKSIYEALPDVVGGGISAVIVEQDIAKAMEVSDRMYCLSEGHVALTGATGNVTRDEISRAYFGM
jgi:branched-chain amino acid transport system ATP-binding protein